MKRPEIDSLSVEDWLQAIDAGRLRLPEFQRDVVWNQHRVCDLIEAILRKRPVGSLLLLPKNAKSEEQFRVRAFEGVTNLEFEYSDLVLDGQQRLSGLWRALNDSDAKYRFFVEYNPDFPERAKTIDVKAYSKTLSWTKDPVRIIERNLIPMHVFWNADHPVWLFQLVPCVSGAGGLCRDVQFHLHGSGPEHLATTGAR